MQSAAVAERRRIARELDRLDARQDELSRKLAEVEHAREELRSELVVLNGLIHRADQEGLSPEGDETGLRLVADEQASGAPRMLQSVEDGRPVRVRGARIREAAVRILAASSDAGEPVHYRVWFDLFRGAGFLPEGKDPEAVFLTQIGRSPVVKRASGAGMYLLDSELPQRARERLTQLQAALQKAIHVEPDAGVEALSAARERRAAVEKEISSTQRELEEALRSLGDERE